MDKETIMRLLADGVISNEVATKYFPELKESERIRKVLIRWIHLEPATSFSDSFDGFSKEQILAWLEKQGEQKPADKVEPKLKIEEGKYYVCTRELLDAYDNKAFHKGDTYLSTKDGSLIPSNSNVPYEVTCADTYFRDWTIQDTKNGDVLVYNSNFHVEIIMIFKSWRNNKSAFTHFHVFNSEHRINDWCDCGKNAHLATKEQRDTLFKAMADAGWEFDFDKKELKKIEDEPDGCEGCNNAKGCVACVDGSEWAHIEESKSFWSEEDENRFQSCLNILQAEPLLGNVERIDANWLKSLKDRYTWKPSEEQIEALLNILPSGNQQLFSLYNDLKKLK